MQLICFISVFLFPITAYKLPSLCFPPLRRKKEKKNLRNTHRNFRSKYRLCKSNESFWQPCSTSQEELDMKETILPLWQKKKKKEKSKALDVKTYP